MSIIIDQNNLKRVSEGNKWRILGTFDLDTSYPAGGYPIIPNQVGLDQVQSFIVNDNNLGYLFDYDGSNLHVYQSGGGTFTGAALPAHDHAIVRTTEQLSASPDTFILTTTASGFFIVGEVITGGTSGATATVTVGNNNPTSDLGFTPTLGQFTVGETITGGTSGTTAVVASGWFFVYSPTREPVILESATGNGIISGRPAITATNLINAYLTVEYDTLAVASFVDFEVVTGGTSGSSMTISAREGNLGASAAGILHGVQVDWANVGFQIGETITGGTSGATAVVTQSTFLPSVVHRTTSSQNPNGDFIMFYPYAVNMSPATFTYLSSNGTVAVSAGTPSGTITGGGAAEVAIGTNLGIIKGAEFEATGV